MAKVVVTLRYCNRNYVTLRYVTVAPARVTVGPGGASCYSYSRCDGSVPLTWMPRRPASRPSPVIALKTTLGSQDALAFAVRSLLLRHRLSFLLRVHDLRLSSCKSLGTPPAHLRAIRLLAGGVWTPDGLGRSLREGGRDPWPVKDLMRGGGPDLFGHVIEVGFSPYQLCFQHDIE